MRDKDRRIVLRSLSRASNVPYLTLPSHCVTVGVYRSSSREEGKAIGQYHYVVNADKREYLMPHRLGDGLKLMEFGNSAGGVMTGLAILLAVSNGRGGGDLLHESELIGSWGGDRIAIVGDYAEDTDLPTSFDPEPGTIYGRCLGKGETVGPEINPALPIYRDISADVRKLIEADGLYRFKGTSGWIERIDVWEEKQAKADARAGVKKAKAALRPDILIVGG